MGPAAARAPGRIPELPIPMLCLELTEKILARVAAGGKKISSCLTRTQKMRDAYRLMLREPTVKAALLTKILGVAHLDLKVDAASDSTWKGANSSTNRTGRRPASGSSVTCH